MKWHSRINNWFSQIASIKIRKLNFFWKLEKWESCSKINYYGYQIHWIINPSQLTLVNHSKNGHQINPKMREGWWGGVVDLHIMRRWIATIAEPNVSECIWKTQKKLFQISSLTMNSWQYTSQIDIQKCYGGWTIFGKKRGNPSILYFDYPQKWHKPLFWKKTGSIT